MDIRIESIHFTADQKLIDLIEEKVGRLEHYYNRIIEAHVFLKLENAARVKDKTVEVKVMVPRDVIVVKETSKTFEAALDVVIDVLKRQVIKKKEISRSR